MNGIARIKNSFAKNKAFIGYLTAGDGGMKRTLEAATALIAGGVNMLEIGVPFSDPIADGPVIQRAATRSLNEGTTLQDILLLVENLRKITDIPFILFSYLNPLLKIIDTSFFKDAQQVGIDGVLLVDCPIEESLQLRQKCLEYNLAPIYVITPTTPIKRIHQIDKQARGFLYYACRKGTTGMRDSLPNDFRDKMNLIKANVRLPIVTGFGISSHETAKQVLDLADGVVVGSLFVKALEDGISAEKLTDLTLSINPLSGGKAL